MRQILIQRKPNCNFNVKASAVFTYLLLTAVILLFFLILLLLFLLLRFAAGAVFFQFRLPVSRNSSTSVKL